MAEHRPWPTSHIQGVAVDQANGFVYYSFTTVLVKATLRGQVVGTVEGWTGHLGDLTFNALDGRVYGSLEYKGAAAFYVAIFDVDKIGRVGIGAQNSDVLSIVYLPEVVGDYTADLDGDGLFAGDTADTRDHRYGCSGIDGIAFGPAFGSSDKKQYLTVAYGIYKNNKRDDNNHQVLLQYDTDDWARFEHPLDERQPYREGPPVPAGKYFVHTGNTRYGVQNLEYSQWDRVWLLSVYPGSKPKFPHYSLFAVSAGAKPVVKKLAGVPGETGAVLPLAAAGLKDRATGIRGWKKSLPYGVQALGPKLYYLAGKSGKVGAAKAVASLHKWTGKAKSPFVAVK